jgi:glycerophosphoryl diester phosphodiesterase
MPIIFAHRGGLRAGLKPNSVANFRDALAHGVNGLESDLRLSLGGTVMLHHDSWDHWGPVPFLVHMLPSFLLRRMDIPTFRNLLDLVPEGVAVSVDAKEPRAGQAGVTVLGHYPAELRRRVYVVSNDLTYLAGLRRRDAEVGLMHEARKTELGVPLDEHVRRVAAAGVNAVNTGHWDWTTDLVAEVHQLGMKACGSIIEDEPTMEAAFELGLDAIYADNVDGLVRALAAFEAKEAGAGRPG